MVEPTLRRSALSRAPVKSVKASSALSRFSAFAGDRHEIKHPVDLLDVRMVFATALAMRSSLADALKYSASEEFGFRPNSLPGQPLKMLSAPQGVTKWSLWPAAFQYRRSAVRPVDVCILRPFDAELAKIAMAGRGFEVRYRRRNLIDVDVRKPPGVFQELGVAPLGSLVFGMGG